MNLISKHTLSRLLSAILIVAISISFNNLSSQDFTRINFCDTLLCFSSGDIVDLDADGDQDILLFGVYEVDYDLITKSLFYKNENGVFYYNTINLPGLVNSSFSFCDYDSDGDLDILFQGYKNIFKSAGPGFTMYNPTTNIYRNEGGNVFVDSEIELTNLAGGSVSWCDYDNDGDNDVFICGLDKNNDPRSIFYLNEEGLFMKIETPIVEMYNSKFQNYDYNNDGDKDIFIAGMDISGNSISYLYDNIGNMQFNECNLDFSSLFLVKNIDTDSLTELVAGNNLYELDYNQNLYLQSSISYNSYAEKIFAFDYDFNGTTDIINSVGNLYSTSDLNSAGDLNNDQYIDFLCKKDTIYSSELTNSIFYILKRNSNESIIEPQPPTQINYYNIGEKIVINWNDGLHNYSDSSKLSYNIKMGTHSGGIDIISPHTDINGVQQMHSSDMNNLFSNQIYLDNLNQGRYYLSMQSINNNNISSSFSNEIIIDVIAPFNNGSSNTSGGICADFNNDNLFESLDAHINQIPFQFYRYYISDFNNDNFLDLLSLQIYTQDVESKPANSNPKILLNNGSGFTEFDLNISGYINKAYIADVDNNGFVDLFFGSSLIYLNNGDLSFREDTVNLEKVLNGAYEFADIDNDSDIDLVQSGYIWNHDTDISYRENITEIYYNENGKFILNDIGLPKLRDGDIECFDMDNDNDLDIFLSGTNSEGKRTSLILSNNITTNSFSIVSDNLIGTYLGFCSNGDFNNDGHIDIVISNVGDNLSTYVIDLFNNNFKTLLFSQYRYPKISLGDFGSDGDLDILYDGGFEGFWPEYGTVVNNGNWPNDPPSPPTNLRTSRNGYGIIFGWGEATDPQSNDGGLSYNLRVGTTPEGVDIVSPMSDITTGYRRISQMGNSQMNLGWRIDTLPEGKYYWAVQAIDHSFKGGNWSEEQTFTITSVIADFYCDTVCFGDTSHFADNTFTSGGAIVSWEWDFGDGNSSSIQHPTHIYNKSGTHLVSMIASDGNFSDTISKTVIVKPVPTAGFDADLVCQGTKTIFINTSFIDSVSISQWIWDFDDGNLFSEQDPGTHGYLNPGDYSAKLRVDATNGCSDSITQTVSVAAYPNPSITSNSPFEFCSTEKATLSTQKDPNYSYQWKIDNTPITDSISNQFTANLSGDYSVAVTNTIGDCKSESDTVTIIARDAPSRPIITTLDATIICAGDSAILEVTFQSGYYYQWLLNGGAIGSDTNWISGKNPGNYIVEVTNENNCSEYSSNQIAVIVNDLPAIPTVNISGPTTFCDGDSVGFSVTPNPLYTYQWKNGSSNIAGAISERYSARSSEDYWLEIANSNNCAVETAPIQVSVNTSPASPFITEGSSTTFCESDSVQLDVAYNPDYTYKWKLNGGAIGQNSNVLQAKSSGTFTVDVTNSGNCSASSINSIEVTTLAIPSQTSINFGDPTSFCEGDSVQLSVPNNLSFAYQWFSQAGALSGKTKNSLYAKLTDEYRVRISNGIGCYYETEPVSIKVSSIPPKPVIQYSSPTTFCNGDSLVLSVDKQAGYSYHWRLDDNSYGSNTSQLTAKISGSYNIDISNESSCKSQKSDPLTIIVNPNPTVSSVNLGGATTFCNGDSLMMSVPYSSSNDYKWTRDGYPMASETGNEISVKQIGAYTLQITNQYDCMTESHPVNVMVLPSPPAPTIASLSETNICFGDSALLNAAENSDLGYRWKLNGGTIGGDAHQLKAFSPGNYSLEVSNSDGCYKSSTNSIDVTMKINPTKPLINFSGLVSICAGENRMLAVTNTQPSVDYSWILDGSEVVAMGDNLTITQSGYYHAKAKNTENCISISDETEVVIYDELSQPQLEVKLGDTVMCPGEPLVVGLKYPDDNLTYQWKRYGINIPGEGGKSIQIKEEGIYSVLASAIGCDFESRQMEVSNKESLPKPDIIAKGPNIWYLVCSNDSAKEYRWYYNSNLIPGANSSLYVANQDLGKYEVSINDGGECFVGSDVLSIPENIVSGIDELDPFENLRIYPNPTPGIFTIEMDNGIFGELDIKIFTEGGKQILNIKFEKSTVHFQTQVDLSGQGVGIYLINFQISKYFIVKKIVVE